MATRHLSSNSQIYGNNEAPIGRKDKLIIPSRPLLRRPALGDIRNKTVSNRNVTKLVGKSGLSVQKSKVVDKSQVLVDKENTGQKHLEPIKAPEKESIEIEVPVKGKVEEISIAFSSQSLQIDDIDADDADDPHLVSRYVKNIYEHLWKLENQYTVKENYLEGQKITHKMRSVLIDWLVQVHNKFKLLPETLYLTVAILDRYLMAYKETKKENLQLVGITSLLIASKYEETYIPTVADFVFITADTYEQADIFRMEVFILNTIQFYISFPIPIHFLRRDSKVGKVNAAHHTLSKYILELSLLEYGLCHVKASLLAASALNLSMLLIDCDSKWNPTLSFYSNCSATDIEPVTRSLARVLLKSTTNSLKAIRNKYASSKFMNISQIREVQASNPVLMKLTS